MYFSPHIALIRATAPANFLTIIPLLSSSPTSTSLSSHCNAPLNFGALLIRAASQLLRSLPGNYSDRWRRRDVVTGSTSSALLYCPMKMRATTRRSNPIKYVHFCSLVSRPHFPLPCTKHYLLMLTLFPPLTLSTAQIEEQNMFSL